MPSVHVEIRCRIRGCGKLLTVYTGRAPHGLPGLWRADMWPVNPCPRHPPQERERARAASRCGCTRSLAAAAHGTYAVPTAVLNMAPGVYTV